MRLMSLNASSCLVSVEAFKLLPPSCSRPHSLLAPHTIYFILATSTNDRKATSIISTPGKIYELFSYKEQLKKRKNDHGKSGNYTPDPDPYRQCCGSGKLIPDPTIAPKEDCEIFFVKPFFVTTNIIKLGLSKKTKNYRTFYQKFCHLAIKNMGLGSGIRIQDPRSGLRNKPIRIPGRKVTGFQIPDPDPQHSKPV
jgi:hypothetical protein